MPWQDTLIFTSHLTAVSAAVKMSCTMDLIGHTGFEVPLNLYHCVVSETDTMKRPAQKAHITKLREQMAQLVQNRKPENKT